MIHGLAVCAGGGGLELGVGLALGGGYRCIGYVEREAYAATVLVKAMEAGYLDAAPIWDDLESFPVGLYRGRVDFVSAGFSCQPHSYAGKRRGAEDERNLWPAVAWLVSELQPAAAFFENVPGILPYYWGAIRPDLCALGYEVAEGLFSAAEVGAPHLRERLFWLAYARHSAGSAEQEQQPRERAEGAGRGGEAVADTSCGSSARDAGLLEPNALGQSIQRPEPAHGGAALADAIGGRLHESPPGRQDGTQAAATGPGEAVGDTDQPRRAKARERRQQYAETESETGGGAFPPGPGDAGGWRDWLARWPGTEPALRRGADGLAFRAERLRLLGNGVVPVVAAKALRSLATKLGAAAVTPRGLPEADAGGGVG